MTHELCVACHPLFGLWYRWADNHGVGHFRRAGFSEQNIFISEADPMACETFVFVWTYLVSSHERALDAVRSECVGPGCRATLTKAPELTTFVEAVYPPEKAAARIQSSTVLELTVQEDGRVADGTVVESGGRFRPGGGPLKQFIFHPRRSMGCPPQFGFDTGMISC